MKTLLFRTFFLFLISLLIFPACRTSDQNPPVYSALTFSGFGPLQKNTPLSLENLKKIFPNYVITEGSYGVEDEIRPLFEVFEGDSRIFKIYPDTYDPRHLRGIGIVSSMIETPFLLRVGDTYSDFEKKIEDKNCVPGAEQLSGQVICTTPEAPPFKYFFAGTWDGPDGEIPPPDILMNFKISEIFWLNTESFQGRIVEIYETGLGPLLGITMKNEESREFDINVFPEDLVTLGDHSELIGQTAFVTYTVTKSPLVVGIGVPSQNSAPYFSPDTPERLLEQPQFKVRGTYIDSVQGDLGLYITLQDEEGNYRDYLGVFELLFENEETYKGKNVELIYIEQEEKTIVDIQIRQ